MRDYKLNCIKYKFDKTELDRKFLEKAKISEDKYWNYRLGKKVRVDFGTAILCEYGANRLDFSDSVARTTAMYLIYKTYSIANAYPSYDQYAGIGNVSRFTDETNTDTALLVYNLVNRIKTSGKARKTVRS